MAWSDKYIGLVYEFGSHDLKKGTDCLRLVEEIYKREMNFHVQEDGKPVAEEWYVKNPERLIRKAVEQGDIIKNHKLLREFDAVFFKMKGIIRHVGVMINNHGRFVHQLNKNPSRVDNINERHWKKRFYCGVRPRV